MIEVTQADRDAAVRIMSDRWNAKHRQEVAAGKHDGWIPVQECARHRLASQEAAIRAAVEAAVNQVEQNAPGLRLTIAAVKALSVEQIMKGMGE